MTDRYSGYVVVLDKDIREDDARHVLGILRQLKGVQSVEPVVQSPESIIIERRVQREMQERLWNAVHGEEK